jgi:hypothetical protein
MKDAILKILEGHQLQDSIDGAMYTHPLISHTEYEKISEEIEKLFVEHDVSQQHNCRNCSSLFMALPGDSNSEAFEQKLFDKSRPEVELFCEHPFTPDKFWNERSGNKPETMLDEFNCPHFKPL